MSAAGRFAERGATFIYLILFAGIMWPPDAYFSGAALTPQGTSNIYDFLEFATLVPFLGIGFYVWRRDLPSLVAGGSPLGQKLGDLHGTLIWVLLGLIGVHVAAALLHLVLGDRVMQRMLPGRPRDAGRTPGLP